MIRFIAFALFLFLIPKNYCLGQLGDPSEDFKRLYKKIKNLSNTNIDSSLTFIDSLNFLLEKEFTTSNFVSAKLIESEIHHKLLDSIKVDSMNQILDSFFQNQESKAEPYYFYLNSKAVGLHVKGEKEDAIKLYKEIVSAADTTWKDFFLMSTRTYQNMASAYRTLGNLDECYNALQQANENMTKYSKYATPDLLVTTKFRVYNSLGIHMKNLKDYEKAGQYYLKAMELYPKENDFYQIALSNYSRVLNDQDSTAKVISLVEGILPLAVNNDRNNLGRLYYQIIQAFIAENKLDRASQTLKDFRTNIPEPKMQIRNKSLYLSCLGNYYLASKLPKLAKETFLERMHLHIKANSKANETELITDYFIAHFMTNKLHDSLFSKLLLLQDSISSKQTKSVIKEWETKYQTEKKEAENQLLKKDNDLAQAQIAQQRTFLGGAGVILLSLGLLLWNLVTRSKERKKNITVLTEKNEAIQALNQEISHRTKNHLALATALLSRDRTSTQDPTVKATLADNENRLRTLTLVNQRLNQANSDKTLNLKDYLQELCDDLLFSLRNNKAGELSLQCDNIQLDSEKVLRLGLITNELITNTIKHAKPQNGKLEISLAIQENNHNITYHYKDNGNTQPNQQSSTNSKGMSLLASMWEQLQGSYTQSFAPHYELIGKIGME